MRYRCAHCGKVNDKRAGNINRSRARGMNIYCDRKCSGLGRRTGKTKAQLLALAAVPQAAPMRNSWPEIDSELTAYIQTIRAQLIEECAKEATRCDTHALFCMADPTAIRQDIASRIRSLSLSRPQLGGEN